MKEKGILLPIFSLPSKYGIGDFGYEAYEFIDTLSQNNIKYWEILPINASNNLPYSPISYYALEEDYISLDKLKDMGLLSEIETKENRDRIIYDDFKEKYYKQAFSSFIPNEEYKKFKQNTKIQEYASFINKYYKQDKEYTIFLQYILDKQWVELREYANSKNVKIVGDMPIYPAYNSCEVEYNPECFELENGKMEYVSGTPPDKYNPNGQKWGNPIYNIEHLQNTNYTYLLERFKEYLKRFDIIRIDHFIGYDLCYKIPIKGSPQDGMYIDGLGYSFFDELMKISKTENYWVEDLGNVRKETKKLRDYYKFIGQNITIFSIGIEEQFDPEFERENMVNYTGNHDSDTTLGWYQNLFFFDKLKLKRYLKKYGANKKNINEALITYCIKSKAKIVVIPVQDIIGLDNNSRINLPGIESNQNWSWKLKDFNDFKEKIKFYAKI